MLAQKLDKKLRRRNIGFTRNLFANGAVIQVSFAAVVEIFGIVADIEDSKSLHSVRLVHLEIETERFHQGNSTLSLTCGARLRTESC